MDGHPAEGISDSLSLDRLDGVLHEGAPFVSAEELSQAVAQGFDVAQRVRAETRARWRRRKAAIAASRCPDAFSTTASTMLASIADQGVNPFRKARAQRRASWMRAERREGFDSIDAIASRPRVQSVTARTYPE